MKAIETTATLTENDQLTLDFPLNLTHLSRVRIIVLIDEDEEEPDPNETPTDRIFESLHQGFKEAFTGQTVPLAQMWDGIDAE
jgi:hypothetical protein